MSLKKCAVLLAGIVVSVVLPARVQADVIYNVQVQTGPLSGTTGWLDFQFNPGAISWQPASARISGFSSDGTLLFSSSPMSPDVVGGVSGGPLPTSFVLSNSSAFNDYFQRITLGSLINFTLTLSGPAIDAPDPSVFSGSSFSFGMYADDQATALVALPPLFQLDIEPGAAGVNVANNAPNFVSIQPAALASVPEPALLWPCAAVLAGLGLQARRRR